MPVLEHIPVLERIPVLEHIPVLEPKNSAALFFHCKYLQSS